MPNSNFRSILRKSSSTFLPGTRFPWAHEQPPARYMLQPLLQPEVSLLQQRLSSMTTWSEFFSSVKQRLSNYFARNSVQVLFDLPTMRAYNEWQSNITQGSVLSFRSLVLLLNTASRQPESVLPHLLEQDSKIKLPVYQPPADDGTDSVQKSQEEFSIRPLDLFSSALLQKYSDGLESLRQDDQAIFITPPQLEDAKVEDMRLRLALVMTSEQMEKLPNSVKLALSDSDPSAPQTIRAMPFFHHWISVRPAPTKRRTDEDAEGQSSDAETEAVVDGRDKVFLEVDVHMNAKFNFVVYKHDKTAADVKGEQSEPDITSTFAVDRPMVLTLRSNMCPFKDGTISPRDRDRLEWTLVDVDYIVQMDAISRRLGRQEEE